MTDINALPRILSNAATGASVTDAMLTALSTRGQKRLFGCCLGRSVEGLMDAMKLDFDHSY